MSFFGLLNTIITWNLNVGLDLPESLDIIDVRAELSWATKCKPLARPLTEQPRDLNQSTTRSVNSVARTSWVQVLYLG